MASQAFTGSYSVPKGFACTVVNDYTVPIQTSVGVFVNGKAAINLIGGLVISKKDKNRLANMSRPYPAMPKDMQDSFRFIVTSILGISESESLKDKLIKYPITNATVRYGNGYRLYVAVHDDITYLITKRKKGNKIDIVYATYDTFIAPFAGYRVDSMTVLGWLQRSMGHEQ